MPDLTTEYFWECTSNEDWAEEVAGSKPGASYIVRHGRGHKNWREVELDFSCTCPAYRYQTSDCKHIEAAKADFCGWTAFLHGGEPAKREDGSLACPKCGADVRSRGWAV